MPTNPRHRGTRLEMDLVSAITFYIVLLVSLVFHEASHAWLALLGGDRTAYLGGQVTLNPAPHIRREPFGTVILPIGMLLFSGGTMCMGFAHAPYDPNWAERHPRRAALMAAGGPLANLILALIAALVLYGLTTFGYATAHEFSDLTLAVQPIEPNDSIFAIVRIASVFLFLNVVLAVLNLFPFPPFDGGAIIEGLVPATKPLYASLRSNPILQIGVVLVPMYVLNTYPFQTWVPVYNLFYEIVRM